MVSVLSYYSINALNKEYKETMGDINLNLTDTATRLTNAQKIDAFTRAVCNLTTNTYKDAEVVTTQSINEILAEGDA